MKKIVIDPEIIAAEHDANIMTSGHGKAPKRRVDVGPEDADTDRRTHRVVPYLRHDEAVFLEQKGAYTFGRYGHMKCPHIRAFHEVRETRVGGPAWFCPICNKEEAEDPAYWEERHETLENSWRAERRNARIFWFAFGAIVSGVTAWIAMY